MSTGQINNDLISIVIPVKNAGPYLKDCLESILNQTHQTWELLAVNDDSSDDSVEILEQYEKQDSRIKLFHNSGKGIIEALRLAYQHSSGAYLTRMDADDLMVNFKLEKMQAQLKEYQYGHIALGQVHYFAEGEIGDGYRKYEQWLNKLTSRADNWKDLYKECVIPSPCWMVHRHDFEKAGAFDSDFWPEDYDLCFRFYQAGLKPIASDEVLHHWRDYQERTSRNDAHYSDNRFLDLKCHYFVKLGVSQKKNLVLWGAGKKGKAIASHLNEYKIDFKWLSNNKNKIGKNIYNRILEDQSVIEEIENPLVIVAVANSKEQEEIRKILEQRKLEWGFHFYYFC